MTQSAGIQLQVGLDLAFFRQQLTTLGTAAAGYPLKFKVEFDRRSIQNELNALGANIKKRNYFLEVKTNLASEIKNAKDLATALNDLAAAQKAAKAGVSQRLGVGVMGRAPREGGLGSKDVEKLYRASAKAGLLAFSSEIVKSKATMVAAMEAVGVDTIAGLLNGLNSQDERVQAAARSLGESLIKSIKTTLGIASPSKKFEEIGKNVGQGFEKGALSSMDNAFDALENKMRQRGKILDTVARGIFRMLGMDPAAMLQQARALPPLNFGATVPRAPAGIGPSSSGRMLPAAPSRTAIAGTPAPAGLLPSLSSAGQSKAIIEALIASTGPRLLPSGGGDDTLGKLAAPRQTKDAVDAILRNYFKVVEAQVREVFSAPPIKKESLNIFDHLNTEQYFNYLAQARINAENAIRQSIEEAKQVAKRNQVKDAAQSFLRALEETVRNAERSIFLQSRIAANQSYVQKANIREIGQPLLGGRQVAAPKMLSAATGFYRGTAVPPPPPETQAQLFARREREARMRSALRGVDVMGETPTRGPARYSYANRPAMPRRPTSAIVPYAAGGALVPAGGGSGGAIPPRPPSGGGGMEGMASFGRALGGINLPGTGVVREIGSEFAMAAKQVLLFGTAYKALAFLTSFPSQVQQAVSSLQSFRNTLKEITPSAQEFDSSNKFILSLVDQYNIPLQSAREGFTKLYASMAPAGFSGQEIRGLFEGISVGAATFGMSADKVDRVMYAFAQMASKGQVMSEELKGQLGDVLPGALSLFARAADMSLADFGKAMEDGAFKGDAMRQLLINVGATMKEEFGKGAVGAALTFQGVMNRLQTTVTVFYETFEPAAVAFSNAFVLPLTNGIRIVTDAFKQLTTGQAATTQLGAELASRIQPLIPIFEGIGNNIKMAVTSVVNFAKALMPVVQLLLQLASTPIVGVLAQAYTTVLLLNGAFTLLGGRILVGLIASIGQTIGQLMLMNQTAIMTSSSLTGTQLQLRLLSSGLTATGGAATAFAATMKTAMMTTVVGAIAVAVAFGISELMRLRGVMDSVAGRYKSIGDQARMMGESGNVSGVQRLNKNLLDQANTYEKIAKGLNRAKRAPGLLKIDKETQNLLKRAGLEGYDAGTGVLTNADANNIKAAINANRQETKNTKKVLSDQEKKAKTEAAKLDATLKKQALPPGSGDDAAAKKAEQEQLRIDSEEQRRRIEAANHDNALMQINFQKDLELTDAGFEHKKSMIDALHDYEMSGLNDMEARQKKFEKDLQDVQLQRVNAVRQALQKVVEAQVATQAAANVSRAAGGPAALALPGPTGGGGAFDTGMRTGPSSAIGGSAPYHQDIMFGSTVSMKERVQLMDQLARGYEEMGRTIEFSNDAVKNERYRSSMSYEAKSSLISRAQAAHAGRPGGSGRPAMDYYAPLSSSNRFGASVEGQAMLAPSVEGASYSYGGGGGAGRTMTASRNGKMVFEQLHGSMAVPLRGGAPSKNATVNTMARRETTEARDVETAQARQSAALSIAELDIQNKIALAYQQTATIIKQNIDSIYPIEKIKLENKLSQIRHNLQMQNMPEEVIAYEERRAAAVEEGALAEEVLKKNVTDTEAQIKKTTATTAENEEQALAKASALEILNKNLELYKQGLENIPSKQKEMEIRLLEGALAAMKNADALKAQQETMSLIKGSVESASSSYKGFMKEVAMGGDPSEALKKFQEAITDQVLTVFFDFAMKPVEDFFKEQLSAMFGVETEESAREKAIAKMEEQLAVQKNIATDVAKIAGAPVTGTTANSVASSFIPSNALPSIAPGFDAGSVFSNPEALAGAFGDIQASIGQSMNGIVSSLENGAFGLNNALPSWNDALATDIPNVLKQSSDNTGTEGGKLQESLGKVTAGIGIAAGAIMGIAAGISQIKEGGTANVLGGIGSIFLSVGGAMSGIMGMIPKGGKAANGAVWKGGFQAFANGGTVTGPTLGLIGEGKYNEAIVPLPDGRSIPVQFNQQSALREAMAGGNNNTSSPSVLSMTFESTNINGVEYVSRDQLEQAMAQTRRQASRDGAQRGMTMTLDKLQQSPSTRSRIGMR